MSQIIKRYLLLILFIGAFSLGNAIDRIDSLEYQLRNNIQPQEKIYIHTDNNSYFAGDTLWYKAYVLRADNLHPTDMSKLLYVELLTPDGYLVERQRIIIDHNTQSFGQFCLPDTIFSGYYELRAYTRWQLNFNVSTKPHGWQDNTKFFNQQFADDFFRDYEDLYSRVFPIYEKPNKPGNYTERYMVGRPKRRLPKEKEGIAVSFFPESSSLLSGIRSRIAFEVLDAYGKPLQLIGHLDDGTPLKTDIDGRGSFYVISEANNPQSAHFCYLGKEYSFQLPTCEQFGACIEYDAIREIVHIQTQGITMGGVSITCRGQLVSFLKDNPKSFNTKRLPTGINEIIVYDKEATPLASRYIFVNHNDLGQRLEIKALVDGVKSKTGSIASAPFQKIKLETSLKKGFPDSFSISVHDIRGDEPTYDDGNILMDLLLAGDLRGFVAHPAYYFESNDKEHRSRLDLLMMIQGWKKYRNVRQLRYEPEKVLSVEGQVFPIEKPYIEGDLVDYIYDNCKDTGNPCFASGKSWCFNARTLPKDKKQSSYKSTEDSLWQSQIILEAELSKGDDFAGVSTETDNTNRFTIFLPPFYDEAILYMTAFQRKDSIQLCMSSKMDKHKFDPFVQPYFEIKQSLFYPIWNKPYSWKQTHSPLDEEDVYVDSPILDSIGDSHQLDNVIVSSKRRRSLHKFDCSKPALECDFGTLLNMTTDYGLHCGAFNPIVFWGESSYFLFGNMSVPQQPVRVSASIDGHYFIKPIFSDLTAVGEPMRPVTLKRLLDPRHIWKVRVFTDYDKRNGIGKEIENQTKPDVYFQIFSIPNDGRRAIRRDRRIVLDGIADPVQFYNRDYSMLTPDSLDFRRTLYWNPNAHPDADGNLNISFYNGSRKSHLKVSVCGINNEGKIFYY